jgi:hypothetical protein
MGMPVVQIGRVRGGEQGSAAMRRPCGPMTGQALGVTLVVRVPVHACCATS